MDQKGYSNLSDQSIYSIDPALQHEVTETNLHTNTPRIQEASFVSSSGDHVQTPNGINGKTVTFADTKPDAAPAVNPAVNLMMARLYDTPQKSQVVQTYQMRTKPQGDPKVGPASPAMTPMMPRPPVGKTTQNPGGAFRTTMFKRDQERRKMQIKAKKEAEVEKEKNMLTVGLLQRKHSKDKIIPPIGSKQKDDEDSMSEVTSEISFGDVEDDNISVKSGSSEKSAKKTVSFEVKKDEDVDKADEDEDDKEIPDTVPVPMPPPTSPSQKSSRSGGQKRDSSQVLTYLKKNKYDDSEPEETDLICWLLAKRKSLGWKTQLPRYGPGCRKVLQRLLDSPPQKADDVYSTKEDNGDFVYCLPRNRHDPRGRYNPYDLEVVSVNKAREHGIFWTASASGISMCSQGPGGEKILEIQPAIGWLWEKELYYMIHQVPIFVRFRLWKAFAVWRSNVQRTRTSASLGTLSKHLFCANEVLQGCLLHVQSLCEAASGSLTGYGHGESAICLVKVNKALTLTLREFVATQKMQCELALKQLNLMRDKVVDIVWKSCATVAEMEGITHGIRADKDAKRAAKLKAKQEEAKELKYKIKTRYGEIPVYEKKAQTLKKDRPSYAQIAEWRKILIRLAEFLKSVDYLMLEFLRRLVKTALKTLLSFLGGSYSVVPEDELEEDDSDGDDSDTGTTATTPIPRRDGGGFRRKNRIESASSTQTGTTTDKPDSDGNFRARTPESSKSGSTIRQQRNIPQPPNLAGGTKQYVIPKYDFDQKSKSTIVADADEILEEIKQQDKTEEIPEPVFSVELVLNVPKDTDHTKKSTATSRKTQKGVLRESRPLTSEKKIVTFPEEPEISASEDSDDSEDSRSGSGEDEDEWEEAEEQGTNRFAYPSGEDGDGSPRRDSVMEELSRSDSTRTHVTLSPSAYQIKHSMFGIVTGFENTVAKVVSMLREPKLSVFYSPPKHDLKLNFDEEEEEEKRVMMKPWPDIPFIFGEDPEYQSMNDELMNYITQSVAQVTDFSHHYDQYCMMVEHARRMDVDGSMSKKQWSTDEFQHVLSIHTEQINAMRKMIISKRIGLILLQGQKFSESCIPFPHSVLQAIFKKMPVIANKRNEDLINIIKGALKKLDYTPDTVEEFVDHLSFLGRMTSEMPALEKEFNIVTKLYTIARDFDIEIPPEELALYQTLAPSFQHLKSTILFCEAKKDENIRKFSTDLDSLINEIRYTIMEIKNKVRNPVLLHSETLPVTALETIKTLQDQVTALTTKARSYSSYQDRFGSSLSQSKKFSEDYMLMDRRDGAEKAQAVQADLSEIERDLTLRKLLWESTEELTRLIDEWTSTPFDKLNVESLQKHVSRFTQTVYMLEKGLPHNEVLPRLKEQVLDFKQGMPVITSLRNPALRLRHWDVIEKIIGKVISKDKLFTLGNLLEMNIFKHKEKIQDISTTASNEATLEIMLNKVIDLWQHTDFRLVTHQARDTWIIAGADDLMAQLEESQVTIGTIRGSRYVTPIKNLVEEWERKLTVFSRTLDEWMTCQRNWLYLEQIFNTPDIQRQLPDNAKLFNGVNKSWNDLMRRTEDRPNALKAATASGTLELLQSANINLEKIHKCLEDFLETKRLAFARFYFLSNDDLLDILAQSRNPDAVQPHLGKCFGNIKSLDIKQLPRQPITVRSMTSAEGEVMQMPKNVRARPPVEKWMSDVEMGMFDTVKKHLKMGLADWVGSHLKDWVLKHPGQVVLTVAQIMFNKDVIHCFNQSDPKGALITLKDKIIQTLNTFAGLVSTDLVSHKRLSIQALLIISVHNRDIVSGMIDKKVTKRDDFEWTRQLRYQWDEQTNNCHVLQSNASFLYGYEYLGCSPRLVITPLTDRCYLTLTGALHLHLGGSPAGPAGTGKTETVKDLAKAMGKQCVVFNCSEGLDFKMLGKFFSGCAQSGSWCCFDEFNRIDVEVLSVVAQQLHTIKSAKDAGAPKFMFEGRDIKLNITCGIFVTMNPTYAGRVELPDNLKSLFRSVAMMVPDYALIAEILLFSGGFTEAKSLSRKIVNLYQLASKQLSQQDHYDFGMRAINSVLVMSAQRKRQHQLGQDGIVRTMTAKEETYILIHSLRDSNTPKFLAEDVPLFNSILGDLFPGVTPPEQDLGVLEKAVSMSIRDQGLQHWYNQVEKVKQLHSQILVRHGVMLVGPTGGGKTTVRNILQRALVLLPSISTDVTTEDGLAESPVRRQGVFVHNRAKKGHVELFTINPKCVKLGELYGETDPNTYEWTDGLIATATRKFAREIASTPSEDGRPSTAATAMTAATGVTTATGTGTETSMTGTLAASPGPASESGETVDQSVMGDQDIPPEGPHESEAIPIDWKWLILDGPVDTLWVENLNTVLDDSKILCLANGERISLGHGMRLIFEVDNLSQASPATISRCAMVYMDPIDLGWKPFVKTWLQRLPKEIPESGKQHLQALFDHTVDKGLTFINQYKKHQPVPVPQNSLVMSLCSILSAFFDFMANNGGFGDADKEITRPGSADSHTSTVSRSSSRTDASVSKTKGKKKTNKRKEKMKEELQNIRETGSSKARGDSNAKQYFMQKNPSKLIVMLGKLFVFAYTWSFGGSLQRFDEMDEDIAMTKKSDGKDEKNEQTVNICYEFDGFVHDMFEVEPPLGVRLPAGHRTVFSYFIDMESGNFLPWELLVPKTQSLIEKGAVITIGDTIGIGGDHGKRSSQHEAGIVTTVDTVRYSFLTALLLLNRRPVLLTGESGVGKTAIIQHMLENLRKDGGTGTKNGTILGDVLNFTDKNVSLLENISSLTRFGTEEEETTEQNFDLLMGPSKPKISTGVISTMLQFSAQTTAARTQLSIMLKLMKKGRDILGGPKGRKVVVFVDDLNLPAPEEYGAQPPLELLRQFLDLGGFYDTQTLHWKDILDVTLIAACGPVGGGRNTVSSRLLKHFCMFAIPQPSTRSLQHIYQVRLGRFFQEGDFMPEVKESLFSLVSASIAMYYKMCMNVLPTPAKSHYTFNIRDLTAVIHGLLQASEDVIVNRENCAQLLAHEATRVFHDRLVDQPDRAVFFGFLAETLHDYFKVQWTPEKLMHEPVLFGDFFKLDEAVKKKVYRPITDIDKLSQILEENFMRQQNIGNIQASQIVFFKEAVAHITRAARVFRQPGGHMMLVGIDGTGKQTTVHLAAHIAGCELFKLTLHRGYSMQDFRDDLKAVYTLAGVKGLNTVFLLTDSDIVKESFLEDINCILNSGDVPDLFDNEEVDGIIVDLKQAAAEAEVADSRAAVYQFFIQRVQRNLHIVLTMSPAGNKFRHRCRMNPSLINCCNIDWYDEWTEEAMLSVASVYFQNADFVATRGENLSLEKRNEMEILKKNVAQVCVDVHKSVSQATTQFWEEMRRRYYITPSSYMELIKTYSQMLKDNKNEFMGNKERLLVGLSKLSTANSLVGTMQEELVTLGPRIEEKARDTELLLEQLEKDQEAVDQVRGIVEQEEAVMVKETQIVQDYADECQRDLNSVIPALQNAIGSLDSLDKSDIAEIRVYTNPPALVMTVMGAVCTLLQQKPDWPTAKQVLGDAGFLKRLVQFDKNNLPDKVFSKLKKFSKHPDFNPEKVGTVSVACRSMCEWVLALEHYNSVYKMVKPKQKRVDEAKDALALAQKNLAQKQQSLAKIQDHLQMLQQQYQDSVNQRESLKERKKLTALRIQRASVLITALADEKIRWADSVGELDFKLQGLVGDTLVSAAAVAYLGAFTAKYRRELVASWIQKCHTAEIPIGKEYDLIRNLAEPNEVLQWQNEGLPTDGHSTENAIFVKRGRHWPVLIDPQGQASKWIQEMEGSKLKVVEASDPNYMRTMERAIRVGEPVLLQEVTESLDPSLRPILLREIFTRGGQQVIKLGDTEIEYNEHFRLYMTTSMSNPHYLPAVCIQVTIINFTVTFEGLQEQLLSMVVKQERPQLEAQRSDLLASIASDLRLLRDLEDKSLGLLQKSEGNILDDQDLVDTLKKSKKMSGEIQERVQQSEETEKSLSQARKKYLPVATRGSVLYFVISDLASVDVMYQFSLPWFQNMFNTCICAADGSRPSSAERSHLSGTLRPSSRGSPDLNPRQKDTKDHSRHPIQDLNKHMKNMIDRLTFSVYKVVSMALFSNHQLMFSFTMCTSIMRACAKYGDIISHIGKVQDVEWTVFLQGAVLASMMDEDTIEEHDGLTAMQRLELQTKGTIFQRPKWVTDRMWAQCQYTEATLPACELLCRSIMNNKVQWKLFAETDDPYHLMASKFDPAQVAKGEDLKAMQKEVFPWEALTTFQRLIIVKILRPEMLTASIRVFVEERMGSKFVSSGAFDLREIFDGSSAKSPLIFILSPGADPSSQLLRFAKELRGSILHLDMISLGRGQGPKAEELISKAQILKGRWVFLQNCHLAASWMPRLQAIVDKFNQPRSDVDPQFRLWLSSKPDPCFPVSILQTGFKMTVESPQGLKANISRSFTTAGIDQLYDDTNKPYVWRNLLFGLCFFNAVIHERKKYGALGWNIAYEFNDSDLEVSLLQLQMMLDISHEKDVPWAALRYLTGEVTYGGRVTDDWDRRCLHSLLYRFYCPMALEPGYNYSPDGVYHPLPASFTFSESKAYVEGLPIIDSPEVFGMNQNAEKAFLESQAKSLVDTIISIQPRLSSGLIGTSKKSDDLVSEIAEEIMRNLPEDMEEFFEEDEEKMRKERFKNLSSIFQVGQVNKERKPKSTAPTPIEEGDEDPEIEALKPLFQSALITVLRQEIDRFNNLLGIIHKSLRALGRAIKGEIVMSDQLEEAYNALLNQNVPAQWKSAAYESCKPLSAWVQDLIQRVDFFAQWSDQVVSSANRAVNPQSSHSRRVSSATDIPDPNSERAEPRSFWLPGFFFPQGFLTGVLQNHARKEGVSVDSLSFNFSIMTNNPVDNEDSLNDVKQKIKVREWGFKGPVPPKEGVLVFGLYLDGARWNMGAMSLQDSLPGQRFCRLPEILFIPTQLSTEAVVKRSETPAETVDQAFKKEEQEQMYYECPLYRTSTRAGTLSSTGHSTNFVTAVSIPTDLPPDFWITRGVALLCQLDD